MKLAASLLAGIAIGLCTGSVCADPPVADPAPVATVVPTLTVSGATNGKGKVTVGLDLRSSTGTAWDTHVAPSFTVSSADGVVSLLSIAGDTRASGPPDWALGLTLSLVDRNPAALDSGAEKLLEARALCRRRAQLAAPAYDETAFYEKHAALAGQLFPSEPDRSLRAVVAARATEVLKRLHPDCAAGTEACTCSPDALDRCKEADLGEILVAEARACSPGGGAGCAPEDARVYAWLARVDTEVDPAALCKLGQKLAGAGQGEVLERARHPRQILALGATYGAALRKALTETTSSVVVGGLYTYVAPSEGAHFSLELPVIFRSSYRASHVSQLWAAVLPGMVAEKGVVRFALGPTFSYDFASASAAPYQIGLQAPVYVSLVKSLAGYSGDYEGVVRLVPSFVLDHTDKGFAPAGVITVELLARRGMFGSSLYWP